jgi:CubicO group peptidase (beta-lactamase class C family)
VEQGKLDLDADVNTYLDFKIPPRHGKPITMRQIMTHRAGFEETIKDLLAFEGPVPGIEEVLKRHIPPRIYEPGAKPAYSNYATMLAGYIVQRLSGEPFDDYIERHIFAPLGMKSSTFRQPLPEALKPRMATGYIDVDKPGQGFEIISMPPAGSLSSTGDDMARFMIAHLQNGSYNGATLLRPDTARLMHTTVTRAFPALNGNLLGFYEQNVNGRRVIAHGGDTDYFHSDLALFIDDNVGLFISVNAPGRDGLGARLRERVFFEFADRYFPAAPRTGARVDPQTAQQHAKQLAGHYLSSRRADESFVSLINLIGLARIVANPDGTVSVGLFGEPEHYVEVQPYLWQQLRGHDLLQARVQDGRVVAWSTNQLAFGFEYEPATGLAGTGLEMPLACAAVALVALAAIAWPAGAVLRRYYQVPRLARSPRRLLAHRLLGAGAALTVVAIAAWGALFAAVASTSYANLDFFVHLCQLMAFVGIGGGWCAALWTAVLDFREGAGRARKAWDLAVLAAFTLIAWLALAYHLIGTSSQY